jgi:hypothetical protein
MRWLVAVFERTGKFLRVLKRLRKLRLVFSTRFEKRYLGVTILPTCPMNGKIYYQGQIEKLVGSRSLHGSDSLCKLLRYLATHASQHPGAPPKEYQIATELFGRHQDFDPHLDSLVRVQAARLRGKLAEYYASEGVGDPIVVELPKGTYGLTFHERAPALAAEAEGPNAVLPGRTASSESSPYRWIVALVLFSVMLAASLAVALDRLLLRRGRDSNAAAEMISAPAPIRTFWEGFLGGHEQPWVIFSNAPFVGRPDTGMRYFDAKRDQKAPTLDYYTGVGEVLAVHALDGVFGQLKQQLRVKRGSLFSLDDAKNNDLIFIGSPSENLTLLEIPNTKQFVFRTVDCCGRAGNVEIVNLHPASREAREYLASPSSQVLTEDYAVVALVPGLQGSHSVLILILAGTTTIGTQAAVEYVCQENSVEELLKALGVSMPEQLKPFEAVIHVKVVRGVPVGSELVALHKAPA